MAAHSIKCPSSVPNACSPKRSRMPASIAAARPGGMIFIRRANRPVAPQITISAEAKIKIPAASCRLLPARPVASSAAPGVDQAVSTGARYHKLSASVLTPMPMPSIVIQPAVWAGVAPAAAAACQIIAAELA